jgi:hypothetical protein
MATIFEENRKAWADEHKKAMQAWKAHNAYKPLATFMEKRVPEMLEQIDADTQTIEIGRLDRAKALAAPELYEALYRLSRECQIEGLAHKAGFDCWLIMAREALAKAEASDA